MTAKRGVSAKAKRKSADRPTHLHLVPPPKPKRRRKPEFKIGRKAWAAKYPPELLRYEEEVVYRAVQEVGGRTTVKLLMQRWPDRFRRRELYWTLLRLAADGRLHTSGRVGHSGRDIWSGWGAKSKPWFARHAFIKGGREFWV